MIVTKSATGHVYQNLFKIIIGFLKNVSKIGSEKMGKIIDGIMKFANITEFNDYMEKAKTYPCSRGRCEHDMVCSVDIEHRQAIQNYMMRQSGRNMIIEKMEILKTSEWKEEFGDCIFFHFHSFEESPNVYCGSPLDVFEGYFDEEYWTHFIRLDFNSIFKQAGVEIEKPEITVKAINIGTNYEKNDTDSSN
jgi:hypothetical protein